MAHPFQVELVACPVQELHVVFKGIIKIFANGPGQRRVVQREVLLLDLPAARAALLGNKSQHLVLLPVIDPLKVHPGAYGPVHGIGAYAQLLLYLVQEVIGAA